jgi:tetratricopeptide (TPR) repeat protein
MKILHLDLKSVQDNYVEFRYFLDNPNDYESRRLCLTEIADLIKLAEQDYDVAIPVPYPETGKRLFDWLDGTERLFSRKIAELGRESIILAIATAERLAHLPWEVLHDGQSFLVAKPQPIVPVRWMSSDSIKKLSVDEAKPENRALNLLFMAASPLGVEQVLDFEKEEGLILKATKDARQDLALIVEESGCLTELGYLIDSHDKGYFDVFHLTGHGTINDSGEPRFYTETETGKHYLASGQDIASSLRFRIPKLLFMSGCRTGQRGKSGLIPSLAEELLIFGAKAVLGWGKKVREEEATAAAAALYKSLAAGYELTEALGKTYQALIAHEARDWHLLRLYVAGNMPLNLVTTLRRGRKRAPKPTVTQQFLDAAGQQVKVPTREAFVGRRRQIQNCLKALKFPSDQVGVLIHGMVGLGKSSLASRLCDRLTEFDKIVWSGKVDEASLLSKLGDKLLKLQREALQLHDEKLKYRLRNLFLDLEKMADSSPQPGSGGNGKPFMLVLDDFENNLESRPNGGDYVLLPEMARILEALVWAIQETDAPHRLILTCRYDFDSRLLRDFYKQSLDGFKGADLQKKCSQLEAFAPGSKVDEKLKSPAQNLADGNPRLLERLNLVLLAEQLDVTAILEQIEKTTAEFREDILNQELLKQLSPELTNMLELALVYQLPVPREAIAAVCSSIVDLEKNINRAIALGLLEVSPDSSLRVPRILSLNLPEDSEGLHRQAAEVLYRLWLEEAESFTEEQGLEIHRLAMLGKVEKISVEIAKVLTTRWWKNQSRFREAVKTCEETLAVFPDYRIFHSLARSQAELGETDAAKKYYQQALDECPPTDEIEKAAILHNLAEIYATQGEVAKAIELQEKSLELQEKMGDVQGKAATLHQLGIIYAHQGEVAKAIAFYEESLELKEKSGNVQGKAATLHCLGIIYADQGEVATAIAFYEQSLELTGKIGYLQGKAATLHQLAGIYANQGEVAQAIALYEQSLELHEKIGNVLGKAATLPQLAIIYAKQGEVAKASAFYEQSLEIAEKRGDVRGKAATLHNLAGIYANQGEVAKAIAFYEESLEITEKMGDVRGKAANLLKLAGIYANQGEVAKASALYEKSLEL